MLAEAGRRSEGGALLGNHPEYTKKNYNKRHAMKVPSSSYRWYFDGDELLPPLMQ